MFQGGFAGKECEIKGFIDDSWKTITEFYPEDNNNLQISFFIQKLLIKIRNLL